MKKIISGFVLFRVAFGGYIDPSTGGMIFQLLVGAFAMVSGAVLVFAGRIKMFMTGRKRRKGELTTESDMLDAEHDNHL